MANLENFLNNIDVFLAKNINKTTTCSDESLVTLHQEIVMRRMALQKLTQQLQEMENVVTSRLAQKSCATPYFENRELPVVIQHIEPVQSIN